MIFFFSQWTPVLSSLTSGPWQPRTDVLTSVVFSVAPLTALSEPEGLFVLSCGSEQKEIASWWSDSVKTYSPGKHRFSLESFPAPDFSNASPNMVKLSFIALLPYYPANAETPLARIQEMKADSDPAFLCYCF